MWWLLCLLAAEPAPPTLWLIGDSTVNNSTAGQMGWGRPLAEMIDQTRLRVINRARGGRSSRTFLTEGLWDAVLAELREGDFVLLQFGHNDGGGLRLNPGRASLKGTGDETETHTDPATGQTIEVHTYGWYLRRYAADTLARGATPVICSPVPRNIWAEGRVARAAGDYGRWARESAAAAGAADLDLNELIAARYEKMGREHVAAELFGPTDHTHTTPAGARVNAECVLAGLRQLDLPGLTDRLPEG